ncbi:MBOAT family O-acyltransferase [Mongoliitalea lutea]|uniref:O-acyltransferase n=1 Tax=Mongoliitalea lutea TaxID=849756 RepID=A0A8J3CX55_9BACT|nr:MBOAT family protein [Mongoliitalea lutea]GHB37141.1 O-acyltransferase [Mongoliitalea lutea]
MLFNSLDFAIFLPIVFLLYWFLVSKKLVYQNGLVVLASYVFYGWWDWRFLSLILFSTIIDFTIGKKLKTESNPTIRKILLSASILINIGFLGFFKYFNFFVDNFVTAFRFLGSEIQPNTLNIILPVGISFYTFQTLSYTIDVYKRKLEPTQDFLAFAAFVSFFPQLVAGPIERASNLLPQFLMHRKFEYAKAVDGMRQILWGLFKKIVIADNCAEFANEIFNNSSDYSGSSLFVGSLFFAFQIYGDFSGYSDIAIGTARLFGFNLKQNFAFPYFSRDIAEFWRRWHISLSTWFRDYLYIPLGGSKGGIWMKIRNTFIIFIVSGFWHGANWTFIVWGVLNALYFLPLLLTNTNRSNLVVVAQGKYFPSLKDVMKMFVTFMLTVLAWVFFRAENMGHAIQILTEIFSGSFFEAPDFHDGSKAIKLIALLILFMVIEWIGRENKYALENIYKLKLPIRWVIYFILVFALFYLTGMADLDQEFIYFQF